MAPLHRAASAHVPSFITAPGHTDYLLVICAFLLVAGVLALGVFFLWLHSLPERMVHNKWQYDLVAVLCLLALFSHVHAFWVAALLLAMIKIPDFAVPDYHTPLQSIAGSLDRISSERRPARASASAGQTAPAPSEPAQSSKGASKNA